MCTTCETSLLLSCRALHLRTMASWLAWQYMVVHVGDDGLPVYEVLDTWLTYCQRLRLKRCDMAAPSEASPETVRHAAPEALAAMPETETQAETMPRPVIKRPLWRVPDTMPETVSPAKAPKRLLEKAPSSPTAWQDAIPATEDEIAASLERVKKEVALREIARNEGVAYEESGAEDAPGSPGLDTLFAGYRTAWSGDVAGTGSGADTNAVAANVEEAGVEENENCEEGGCDESNIDLAPLGGAMEVHVHETKMDKEVTPKYRSTTGAWASAFTTGPDAHQTDAAGKKAAMEVDAMLLKAGCLLLNHDHIVRGPPLPGQHG